MKALTDCVSASLRQSATIDQGGNAGRSFKSFKRGPAVLLTQLGRRVNSCPTATAAIRLVPHGIRPVLGDIPVGGTGGVPLVVLLAEHYHATAETLEECVARWQSNLREI